MHRGTAYLNRHLMRKEHEIQQDAHQQNLKQAKPTLANVNPETVIINRRKQEMIVETRLTEIQRENHLLLEKISAIMGKQPRIKHSNNRPDRSLNTSSRRKEMQHIQLENARLLRRLEERRTAYPVDQLRKEWKFNKKMIKTHSLFPVCIKEEGNRIRVRSRSKAQSLSRPDRNNHHKLRRVRLINGHQFVVTVTLDEAEMKIVADPKDKKTSKIIEVPREEADQFIAEECQGDLSKVLDCLHYNSETDILFMMGADGPADSEELVPEKAPLSSRVAEKSPRRTQPQDPKRLGSVGQIVSLRRKNNQVQDIPHRGETRSEHQAAVVPPKDSKVGEEVEQQQETEHEKMAQEQLDRIQRDRKVGSEEHDKTDIKHIVDADSSKVEQDEQSYLPPINEVQQNSRMSSSSASKRPESPQAPEANTVKDHKSSEVLLKSTDEVKVEQDAIEHQQGGEMDQKVEQVKDYQQSYQEEQPFQQGQDHKEVHQNPSKESHQDMIQPETIPVVKEAENINSNASNERATPQAAQQEKPQG